MVNFFTNLFYEQYMLSIPDPIASFSHKTVIITGSNNGLGKEAARHIARLGCTRLILAVRNVKAGEEAREEIIATTGCAPTSIHVWHIDMADFSSVRQFAARAEKELDRLDVLICNAGISTFKYAEKEGYESMLTVNVLGTYLLATQMLPILEKTAAKGGASGDPYPRPPHLTIIGSDTHLMAAFPEKNEPADQLLSKITTACKESDPRLQIEYANSKLMILLLGRDLVYRKLKSGPSTGKDAVDTPEKKCPVIINVANPGLCYSNLINEKPILSRVLYTVCRARPTAMGGAGLVNAAAAGWESNGQYLTSNAVNPGSDLSWDHALAEKLAIAVEKAVGIAK